jgi:nucleoside-diphosphate-sugar epimerase
VRPAVDGTKNVPEAASAAKVRRVVVVSSIVAVDSNPKDWPTYKFKDENSWSDEEFCRNNEVLAEKHNVFRVILKPTIFHRLLISFSSPWILQDWYSVSKITAEKAAHEYGEKTGLDVVILNPAVVFGPLLQPTVNASNQFLIYFLKGNFKPSNSIIISQHLIIIHTSSS